jgi:hypothetical protein
MWTILNKLLCGSQLEAMSRCNPAARWGPGTTCERPVNTANARDLEAQLAAMRYARESVDKMWSGSTAATTAAVIVPQKPVTSEVGICQIPKKGEDLKYITFRSSN